MGEKRAYKPRKPGGGRKKLKPEYDAGENLKEQIDAAVALYNSEMSLQAIGEELEEWLRGLDGMDRLVDELKLERGRHC